MKHKFISKRYWKDTSTAMGQSDALAKSFDDCINLSLGDPDLITDTQVIEHAWQMLWQVIRNIRISAATRN